MAFHFFQRGKRSLFGEILDWMLIPLMLIWPLSLVLTWLVAQNTAGRPFDRALEYNVQALAQLVHIQQSKAQLNLPAPAREILRADETDIIYYQVLGVWGEYIAGERGLPQPYLEDKPVLGKVYIRADEYQGRDIRVAYIWADLQNVHDRKSGDKPVLVQVAETLEKRSTLATEIIKGVMLPQLLMLPLVVLLIWLALIRGTEPIKELEHRIRQRKSDDVSALDLEGVPREVSPLIASINDLLARLNDSMTIQKRFLADAAHQLKTPLAGLRMQADLALREGVSTDDLKHSLKQVGRSSVRATRTVNQLLALARAEATGSKVTKASISLERIVLESVRDALPQALDKRMDLGYDDSQPVRNSTLLGNAVLLKELVRNLLENAIHYTPERGIITARVLQDASGTLALQVEDTGPGIPVAERERVLQPFYRMNDSLSNRVDGSGLGLAIVHAIAKQHQATVIVDDAHPQQTPVGTRFTVRFG
ncbi:MAG: sensor histidine kinase N-terminal domain-containing protein [Cytophagales bacterium]|nr:sensor histidine kinase N-terminal domain-containing protein [Cytophagales bacterium]